MTIFWVGMMLIACVLTEVINDNERERRFIWAAARSKYTPVVAVKRSLVLCGAYCSLLHHCTTWPPMRAGWIFRHTPYPVSLPLFGIVLPWHFLEPRVSLDLVEGTLYVSLPSCW